MNNKTKSILITIMYFVITIIFLSSVGVWLPIMLDDYNLDHISNETYSAIAGNILTYSLSIFLVAIIDRILLLISKTSKYHNNIIEFFVTLILLILTSILVYHTLKDLRKMRYVAAIKFSFSVAIITWIYWLFVKFGSNKEDNFSSIGGSML